MPPPPPSAAHEDEGWSPSESKGLSQAGGEAEITGPVPECGLRQSTLNTSLAKPRFWRTSYMSEYNGIRDGRPPPLLTYTKCAATRWAWGESTTAAYVGSATSPAGVLAGGGRAVLQEAEVDHRAPFLLKIRKRFHSVQHVYPTIPRAKDCATVILPPVPPLRPRSADALSLPCS